MVYEMIQLEMLQDLPFSYVDNWTKMKLFEQNEK